ncbi:unnamed protein product [Microthlaspi erraticum]|uniref:Uncharacterized protein n=1 Tax=Microthlaspi erraticum TaxID=1685480 RepID=A0A6D2JAK2_9BRAS|nr:unnamed protein product [Microthlaspi erraticum]
MIGRAQRKLNAANKRGGDPWEHVEEYKMFDLKGSTMETHENICDEASPCPIIVLLYARMGLHRYNLLQGTKLALSRVQKYVNARAGGVAAGSYYITLDAMDPAVGSSSLHTFQTHVTEESFGCFILTSNIARIRGDSSAGRGEILLDHSLPEWPAENPFEKYYLVKEPDNEWIRLYMELVVVTNDWDRKAEDFGPKLEIVKVAMDANGEGPDALNAVFYLRFKDLYEAQIGKALDRFAIVRRRFNEEKGSFSLVGSEVEPNVDSQMKALHL